VDKGQDNTDKLGEKKRGHKMKGTYQLLALLASKWLGIVVFVPCAERSAIDQNNAVLDQSLRSNQFVIGGVVQHINNTGLAGGVC